MGKTKGKQRRNEDSGLAQKSLWLNEADVQTLRVIGERPEIDREWSWLVRKAIREYIERDEVAQAKKAAKDSKQD
jgi:hypothetical protein